MRRRRAELWLRMVGPLAATWGSTSCPVKAGPRTTVTPGSTPGARGTVITLLGGSMAASTRALPTKPWVA